MPPSPIIECSIPMDVVFLIDRQVVTTEEGLDEVKAFLDEG